MGSVWIFQGSFFSLNTVNVVCNQLNASHHTVSTLCITGYSIFVVMGTLPESEADQLLKLCPAKPEKKSSKSTTHQYVNKSDLTAALQEATRLGGGGKTKVV